MCFIIYFDILICINLEVDVFWKAINFYCKYNKYEIKNSNLDSEGRLFKNSKETKKNNFKLLYDLTDNGVYRGEKRNAYWGVKFYQSLNVMVSKVSEILLPRMKNLFFLIISGKIFSKKVCWLYFIFFVRYFLNF